MAGTTNSEPVVPSNAPAAPPSVSEQSQMARTAAASQYGDGDGTSTVRTLEDFKKVNPKLYKAMMEGICTIMISQMQNQQEGVIRAIKEGRRTNR